MKLYKYIGLNSEYGAVNCETLLRENKIWSSAFQKLNDPFEFRFMLEGPTQDRRREFPIAVANSRNGVISFSGTNDDLLLWSHYGSAHRGICFEFLADSDPVLSTAKNVKYVPTVPTYSHEKPDEILLSKSDRWAYENEYRVLTNSIVNSYVDIAPESMRAVYFGINITYDDVIKFNPLCSSRGIKIFQANSIDNQYKIEFKQVTKIDDYSSIARKAALQKIIEGSMRNYTVRKIISRIKDSKDRKG